MKKLIPIFILFGFLMLYAAACDKPANTSKQSDAKAETPKVEDAETKMRNLQQKLKPSYDEQIRNLENETLRKQTETAKLPRGGEASQWVARIAELKVERESLNKRAEIDRNYLQSFLQQSNDIEVKNKIQSTTGQEIERTTLERNKRIAEIDRESKDLDIKVKSWKLDLEHSERMNKLQNEQRIREAELGK